MDFMKHMLVESTMDERTIHGARHILRAALVKYNDDETKHRIYIKSLLDTSISGYVQYEKHSDAILTYQNITDIDSVIEYMKRHLTSYESFDWKIIVEEELEAMQALNAAQAEDGGEGDAGGDLGGGGGEDFGGGGGEDFGGGGGEGGGGEEGFDDGLGGEEGGFDDGFGGEEGGEPAEDFNFDFDVDL